MFRHSWRTQLKSAADDAAVLTVVNGYLGEWKADEVACLPPGAWPGEVRTVPRVLEHSLTLGRMHAARDRDGAPLALLQELLLFFTHAAVRAKRVALDALPDRPGQRPGIAVPRRRPVRRARRPALPALDTNDG